MKLYNKTRIPDAVLEPILLQAGRSVGARTANVVVIITQNRRPVISGTAYECAGVSERKLRRVSRATYVCSTITTDGGFFYLRLPKVMPGYGIWSDPLHLAETVLKIAAHEWAHVQDYQAGGRAKFAYARRTPSGRRERHDSRPEELRATNAADDAVQKGLIRNHQDNIINLAIALKANT